MTWQRAVAGLALAAGLGFFVAFILLGDVAGERPRGKTAPGLSPGHSVEVERARDAGSANKPADGRVAAPGIPPEGDVVGKTLPDAPSPFSLTLHVELPAGSQRSCTVALYRKAGEDGERVAWSVTGDDGEHQWALPEGGEYYVVLEHDRCSVASPVVPVSTGNPHAEVHMRVGRCTLTGLLNNAFPLEIRLASASSTDPDRGGFSGSSDEKGAFSIEGIPEGEYVLFVPARFHLERIRIDGNVQHVVRLSHGRIEGRVTDKVTGTAVEDVEIVLNAISLENADLAIVPPNLMDRFGPDPDGTFAVTSLPAGRYRLFAFCEGYRPCIQETALAGPADARRVDLVLEREGGQ